MTDVADRLGSIRERVEAATEGPWKVGQYRGFGGRDEGEHDVLVPAPDEDPFEGDVSISGVRGDCARKADAAFIASARQDVPYLLSLVEETRDQLCKYTCECGPAHNTDPEAHADYCLYRSALRDAAQEGAE